MQVDPQLHRLQTLIEQKRAQQNVRPTSTNVVGRAGNPRFAAAAERVRNARQVGTADQALPQTAHRSQGTSQIQKKHTIVNTVPIAVSSEDSGSLLTLNDGERTLSLGQTGQLRTSPPHLGRNLDTYA